MIINLYFLKCCVVVVVVIVMTQQHTSGNTYIIVDDTLTLFSGDVVMILRTVPSPFRDGPMGDHHSIAQRPRSILVLITYIRKE